MTSMVLLFSVALGAPILWLVAERRAGFIFRVLSGLLSLTASVLVLSSLVLLPRQKRLAVTRHSFYGTAENILSLLDKNDVATVTNSLIGFLETRNDWDAYPHAAHRLMMDLEPATRGAGDRMPGPPTRDRSQKAEPAP